MTEKPERKQRADDHVVFIGNKPFKVFRFTEY